MRSLFMRTAALGVAGLAALATFVTLSWFRLGFMALAATALVVFWAVAAPGLKFVAARLRGGAAQDSRTGRLWLAGGTVAYIAIAQWMVGFRPSSTLVPPERPPGTREWALANGSHLAYAVTEARGPRRKASPVLVLHDGPGMPMLPRLQRFPARPYDLLADEGYDVYYYDQLGGGLSSRIRLADEPPYSVSRHVQDVEEIRRALGVRQLVLLGEGWGATLAIQYLRAHPDRVERVIAESPAPLWYGAWPEYVAPAARARMTDVEASALAVLGRPTLRLVIGRMMSDFNPRVAHAIIEDWEADQWWTRYQEEALRSGQPKVSCASATPEALLPLSGLGFFAYSYTLRDAVRMADSRPELASITVPVLVMRGSCDYVDWRVSYEYLRSLPEARYVAIPAAGHLIWLDQPSLHAEVLLAFVRGEALPLEFYEGLPMPRR